MKSMILVALALMAVAVAVPVEVVPVKIIRSNFDQRPEGSYVFDFESDDGVVRSETGEVKEVLDEDKKPTKVVFVRGFYSYTDSNGNPEKIVYYADDTGYHADGPSVPKIPTPQARR